MDNELIRDLFKHVIQASEILGVDASFRSDIAALRAQLPPDQVGKYGQLQEWLEDIDANPDGHRHCSHLVGFQPGDEISPFYTPTLAAAAKTSVDFRGDVATTAGLTPWGMSVRINLQDRCQNGDRAYDNLINTYSQSKVATNLVFADGSANKQVDSVFGRLSGIAEMFLQSQSGEVFLLPALPTALTNGMVSGLCARGGFQVDNLSWTNGRLAGATILSKVGNTCRLRSRWPIDVMVGANHISAPMVLPGLYEFPTVAGGSYDIVPAYVAETENLSATTSGDAHATVVNAGFSDWRGQQFSANAVNDYVTYTVPNLSAGTYHVYVGADAGANRGSFQLAAGPSGGSLVDIGSAQDTYSSTNMAQLLPIRLTPPTTVSLWTNLLSEYDCGTLEVASTGNYDFKFTVEGKNPSSSGYALVLDYIKFAPPLTAASGPPLTATLAGAQIVLSWSTNFTGYSLTSATSLPAAAWLPVLPAPTVVGELNVVTNDLVAGQAFYRLESP
jgi:hypothetical protein